MNIKKGDKFLCTKTVTMQGSGNKAYIEGKTYSSDYNGCITNEFGDIYHYWDETDNFKEYFKEVKDSFDDKVNHPSHYSYLKKLCGVEVIDIARYLDFDTGNALKYILRAGHKSEEGYSCYQKAIEDLEKAIFYIQDRINYLKTIN